MIDYEKHFLQNSYDKKMVSEFGILSQKWSKIAPLNFGSVQSILLGIVWELEGGGSVAVGVGDNEM